MTSLALLFAPILALQTAGGMPVTIENDKPETWTLEYPRLIQPLVADYRRCLGKYLSRITGEPNFEQQHREAVGACHDEFETAQQGANELLAGRERYAEYSPQNVRILFDRIGLIHVARGADLDNQFTFFQRSQKAAVQEYQADRPKGLVLELHDASVVKSRTDTTAAAAEAAYQEREARNANN